MDKTTNLFEVLEAHEGHSIEIQDTTNHGNHVSEYEIVCTDCETSLIRADNPDGDIY